VDDQTERVTNAEGIDLGLVALPAGERIISWRASIVIQAKDFAAVVSGILRVLRAAEFARVRHPDGHVDLSVAAEHHPRHRCLIGERV
jgi:hypothetical protein